MSTSKRWRHGNRTHVGSLSHLILYPGLFLYPSPPLLFSSRAACRTKAGQPADQRAVSEMVSELRKHLASALTETFPVYINVRPCCSTSNGEREPLCLLDLSSALVHRSMGCHRCFVRLTSNTASLMQWMYPLRSVAKQGDGLQPAQEFVSVEIKLLSGVYTFLRIVSKPVLGGLNADTVFTLLTLRSCRGQQFAGAYVQRSTAQPHQLHRFSWIATKHPMHSICSPSALSVSLCRNPASSCAQCLTWSPFRPAHLQAVKLSWFPKPDAVPEALAQC